MTVVADRETDIYEMFACRPGSVEVLIRASHDRVVEGQRPLEDVFSPADREALEAVSVTLEGRTERQRNPYPAGSLAFAAWVCARLGGWICYYGKPGPVVMLRGLYQFRAIQLGYDLTGHV